ncbi:MAG: hypothetical protein K6G26_04900, partial [Lachnospiraceae bacterium]|nr:hypothetical protein [Lachnospiraceae bacterium]
HIIDEKCFDAFYSENYTLFIEKRAELVKDKFAALGINIKNVEKEQIDKQIDDEDLTSDIE